LNLRSFRHPRLLIPNWLIPPEKPRDPSLQCRARESWRSDERSSCFPVHPCSASFATCGASSLDRFNGWFRRTPPAMPFGIFSTCSVASRCDHVGSRLRLPNQLDQPGAHLELDVETLAPAPADDPADLTAPLGRAGLAGVLEPIREREAPIRADADPGVSLGHRRGDLFFGELGIGHGASNRSASRSETTLAMPSLQDLMLVSM